MKEGDREGERKRKSVCEREGKRDGGTERVGVGVSDRHGSVAARHVCLCVCVCVCVCMHVCVCMCVSV